MKITVGAGKKNPNGHRFETDDLAGKFEQDEAKAELWWSPHVWDGDRRSSASWESSSAIAIDVDAHVPGTTKKMPIDLFLDVIEQGFDFGLLPGSVYHSTPHGFRLILFLSKPCSDRVLYRAAAEGALNLVAKALPELEIDPQEIALDLDRGVTTDLARLLWHPKAIVEDHARTCRTLGQYEDENEERYRTFDAVALSTVRGPVPAAPPPPPPPAPPAAPKPAEGDLKAAVEEWISSHPKAVADLEASIASGECPACGHRDCFKAFKVGKDSIRGKATCFSDNHTTDAPGIGRPTSQGVIVDALDLFAYRADRNPVAILGDAGVLPADEPPPEPVDGKVVVMLSRGDPHHVTDVDFADAVLAAMPKDLFFRAGGRVGAIRIDGDDARHDDVSPGEAKLLAQRHVEFRTHRYDAGSKAWKIVRQNPTGPQSVSIVENARTSSSVPDLQGVYTTPTFAGDFALLSPGFNPATGLYYREASALAGLRPNLSSDAASARRLIDEYFEGFDDVLDAEGKAHALALIVTLVVRPSLPIVPIFATFSSIEGSGKTTLVDEFCGTLVHGRPPAHLRTLNETELPKTLFAHARAGTSFAVLDNVKDGSTLDSPLVAELITSTQYDARVLGVSTIERPRNLFTIAATGNNVSLSPEITRRAVPITFRPKQALADRTFSASPAEQIAKFRRPMLELVIGAVERWKMAGRPKHPSGRRVNDFPAWSDAVGGILGMLGVEDFLSSIATFREEANSWDAAARSFLAAWYQSPVITNKANAGQLVQLIEEDPTGLDIHSHTERGVQIELANRLRRMVARPSLLPYSVRLGARGRSGGHTYVVGKEV